MSDYDEPVFALTRAAHEIKELREEARRENRPGWPLLTEAWVIVTSIRNEYADE